MLTQRSLTLAGRFAWLFDGLCKVIGAEASKRQMEAALAWALWNRVQVLGERLVALAERVRAGRFKGRRSQSAPTPHPNPPPQGGREREWVTDRPLAGLSREFGWVRRMLPETGQFVGVLILHAQQVAQRPQDSSRLGRRLHQRHRFRITQQAARWVAGRVDAPSTLLPLGLSPALAFPGTGPPGSDSKNRG
jgi:hypothetical protein